MSDQGSYPEARRERYLGGHQLRLRPDGNPREDRTSRRTPAARRPPKAAKRYTYNQGDQVTTQIDNYATTGSTTDDEDSPTRTPRPGCSTRGRSASGPAVVGAGAKERPTRTTRTASRSLTNKDGSNRRPRGPHPQLHRTSSVYLDGNRTRTSSSSGAPHERLVLHNHHVPRLDIRRPGPTDRRGRRHRSTPPTTP